MEYALQKLYHSRSMVEYAQSNAVYQFIRKKEQEGKQKKQAKIAGINKFLRIYYARVNEVYTNAGVKT